jgi:hypothetical protein
MVTRDREYHRFRDERAVTGVGLKKKIEVYPPVAGLPVAADQHGIFLSMVLIGSDCI